MEKKSGDEGGGFLEFARARNAPEACTKVTYTGWREHVGNRVTCAIPHFRRAITRLPCPDFILVPPRGIEPRFEE
jgi:hypothetical protein